MSIPSSSEDVATTAGSRPAYSATGRNSKPALSGNGTSLFMSLNTRTTLPQGTGPGHMFAAAFHPNTTGLGWKALLAYGTSDVLTARQIAKQETTDKAGVTTGSSGAHVFPSGAPAWLGVDKIVSGVLRDGKAEAVVDGQYSAALTPALNTPAPTIADLFRFTNGAGYWGGSVQEILIYNIEHSVYDRQRLEGYIASKWGLRGLLAAGHPYKSTNPPPGGGDIVVTGYLPTAEITAQLNPEVYADLDGLLPTAAGLLDTEAPGPITISVTTGTGPVPVAGGASWK